MPEPFPLSPLPPGASRDAIEIGMARWRECLNKEANRHLAARLRSVTDESNINALMERLFFGSGFLTECVLTDPEILLDFLARGPQSVLVDVLANLKQQVSDCHRHQDVQSAIRKERRRGTLAIALADITCVWSLEQVLAALSELSDAVVSAALSGLLLDADRQGEIEVLDPARPERSCGYTLIAMGKLGARELNFSSDIDLIAVYDPENAPYRHARGPQEGYVRLTRALVKILDEQTADGFAYRTDFRLRPDPGAMPLAISYDAAMTYYESIGQNWERAAMIKARPVAGDLELGHTFLAELRPFIWRKHLDFYALQDIHSIKRQIHSHKGGGKVAVLGHNIKLGRGGIREIEFFAQTQQLIWGGREPGLREPGTLSALAALAKAGHISANTATEMSESYRFLRKVENRLQMQEDRQVHSLPADRVSLERFALFLGYEGADSFEKDLISHLSGVEAHYAKLFEEAPDLSGPGNLVFTGGEPEPATMASLEKLGFSDGAKVFNLVRSWHHGRYRATRSTRSRQILTEFMPTLLASFGKTLQPDQALTRFDTFLSGLPAGVQLFSLLHANPKLMDLLAEIMGGAPLLAEQLGSKPGLLEAVLSFDFFKPLPSRDALEGELRERLGDARDFQDILDLSRQWSGDRRFQVGVHILRATLDVDATGHALSDIAESVLRAFVEPVEAEFAARHGRIEGSRFAVLAMGKLGGREMTVSSDLDLVFLYDHEEGATASDGQRPLDASQYFAKLAQRFINAVTARTAEGTLYDIDMRLRPSGNAGPIASRLPGFFGYYKEDAWTWEHMALTRARPIYAEADFGQRIDAGLRATLTLAHDPRKLLKDVAEMRLRIEREKPARSIWSVKFLRGGLTDLEFLAHSLQRCQARDHPEVLSPSTEEAFGQMAAAGLITQELATTCASATRFMRQVQGILRLTVGPAFDADTLPDGLQAALARAGGMESFALLRERLIETAANIEAIYREIIDLPAQAILDQD